MRCEITFIDVIKVYEGCMSCCGKIKNILVAFCRNSTFKQNLKFVGLRFYFGTPGLFCECTILNFVTSHSNPRRRLSDFLLKIPFCEWRMYIQRGRTLKALPLMCAYWHQNHLPSLHTKIPFSSILFTMSKNAMWKMLDCRVQSYSLEVKWEIFDETLRRTIQMLISAKGIGISFPIECNSLQLLLVLISLRGLPFNEIKSIMQILDSNFSKFWMQNGVLLVTI